jgi:hypothetical protein
MSDVLAEGEGVVRAAEASLRDLMQVAVRDGQYDRVAVLARWAEQLSRITGNGAAAVQLEMALSSGGVPLNGTARRAEAAKSTKRRKSKYPLFKRSGDNLVKVAWSKASKSEYQHQAPKSVIFALVEKMAQAASDDTLIKMDNVLPLAMNEQPEVPAYQSYASLAWLREIGVVEQHGRQGYSVVAQRTATKLIEESWSRLPVFSRGVI